MTQPNAVRNSFDQTFYLTLSRAFSRTAENETNLVNLDEIQAFFLVLNLDESADCNLCPWEEQENLPGVSWVMELGTTD